MRVILAEVMLVCLSRRRVPLTSEHALTPVGVIERDVKTSDAGEKIDELVGGLLCHGSPKHIQDQLESHKWTPVHPGELG